MRKLIAKLAHPLLWRFRRLRQKLKQTVAQVVPGNALRYSKT